MNKNLMILSLNKVNIKDFLGRINKGEIIIFPTDIEYCIGCDALNKKSVKKLRKIINSKGTLTILPHNKQWIYGNLGANKEFIKRLPGPYLYIVNIPKETKKKIPYLTKKGYIGIRVPKHEIIKIIQRSKKPFIIERISNRKLKDIAFLDKKIRKKVDLILDGGEIEDKAFSVLDIREKLTKIVVR